jgi:hypothetical protein
MKKKLEIKLVLQNHYMDQNKQIYKQWEKYPTTMQTY